MKYVVVFAEGYVGYFFDEASRVFDNKEEAEAYAEKLNMEFAVANRCRVEDLGDYYEVVDVEEYKKYEE